jgi:hypothetical protein
MVRRAGCGSVNESSNRNGNWIALPKRSKPGLQPGMENAGSKPSRTVAAGVPAHLGAG